jgi:hypothetical protein
MGGIIIVFIIIIIIITSNDVPSVVRHVAMGVYHLGIIFNRKADIQTSHCIFDK